jgi:ribonuclease HII
MSATRPTKRPGQKLLRFDRGLLEATRGGRLVAGADEAGRGPLAGPLVIAGVLLDYDCLRDHRVRPLALLNDSKQVNEAVRDELYRAVISCAERVSVHVFPPGVIDRDGLHKCNLNGLRDALWACQPADVSLVDGFKLGPSAPRHRAVVDGDTKSAAIAAASIVAKVTRDRYMRMADALYPGYGFASHVGYITPAHKRIVRERGPCEIHRLSWRSRAYLTEAQEAELVAAAAG